MNRTKEFFILLSGVFFILIFISFLVYQTNILTKTSIEKKRLEMDSTLLIRVETLEKQDSLILHTLNNIVTKIDGYQIKQRSLISNQVILKKKLKGLEEIAKIKESEIK